MFSFWQKVFVIAGYWSHKIEFDRFIRKYLRSITLKIRYYYSYWLIEKKLNNQKTTGITMYDKKKKSENKYIFWK